MNAKGEKDGWGDKLRAAERAREDLYFAKIDEKLLAKIREEEAEKKQAQAEVEPEAPKATNAFGCCPRCDEPLRRGLWRELKIEFCNDCGGLWLDQGDLLDLADRGDVNLHLSERGGVETL